MKISNLPGDVVREILSRVPLTSLKTVRATCKDWNDLSKNQIVGKKAARKPFLGFIVIASGVFAMKFHLQNIRNQDEDFVGPSINQFSILNQLEINNIYHCHGLLLCTTKDHSKLVAWNPYLGESRWIEDINTSSKIQDVKASSKFETINMYSLGYDNNKHTHKILRFFVRYDCYKIDSYKNLIFLFEIYDFSSNSWKVLEVVLEWVIWYHRGEVSLKGNTYFIAQKINGEAPIEKIDDFLLCFDFTRERFGPRLPLPFQSYYHTRGITTLSCVRDDKLAVLYERNGNPSDIIEIWITTKIEPNAVLWSKFLRVVVSPLNGFPDDYQIGSFFIDEEDKSAVALDSNTYYSLHTRRLGGHVIGEDRYLKSVYFQETPNDRKLHKDAYYSHLALFSSYVPSLVRL